MVEQLTDFPRSSAARARVTKDDYTRVLIPAALGKLRTDWKVRMYYKIAEDFSGFYPGAMWEDLKVGVDHVKHIGADRTSPLTAPRSVDDPGQTNILL
jgi:hypothetical protein